MGGERDSSRTRVQPVFGAALARDPTGEHWLPAFLQSVGAKSVLGNLVQHPGILAADTVVPSASKKAELACFEVQVPPDRRLLSWCIEHPESLKRPPLSNRLSNNKRRELILDDPPGSRGVAQTEARAAIDSQEVGHRAWWRFERNTEVDCVLSTDRLVLCIEGKRCESLAPDTTWLEYRNQVARNLEAAWRLAGVGRAFAVVVCVERLGDPVGEMEFVQSHMAAASPHLFAAEREALAKAYIGQVTWLDVCRALRLNRQGLPETVEQVPGCERALLDI